MRTLVYVKILAIRDAHCSFRPGSRFIFYRNPARRSRVIAPEWILHKQRHWIRIENFLTRCDFHICFSGNISSFQ